MKTRFLLALALFAPLLAAGGPKNVKGYVYQDDNRNGVFDKTEKGIPGVAVSNGREVVLTDRKGRYQLPVTGPCEIFVIKPAGYAPRPTATASPSRTTCTVRKGPPRG